MWISGEGSGQGWIHNGRAWSEGEGEAMGGGWDWSWCKRSILGGRSICVRMGIRG